MLAAAMIWFDGMGTSWVMDGEMDPAAAATPPVRLPVGARRRSPCRRLCSAPALLGVPRGDRERPSPRPGEEGPKEATGRRRRRRGKLRKEGGGAWASGKRRDKEKVAAPQI